MLAGKLASDYEEAYRSIRARFATERPSIATRQASQQVIDVLAVALPNFSAARLT